MLRPLQLTVLFFLTSFITCQTLMILIQLNLLHQIPSFSTQWSLSWLRSLLLLTPLKQLQHWILSLLCISLHSSFQNTRRIEVKIVLKKTWSYIAYNIIPVREPGIPGPRKQHQLAFLALPPIMAFSLTVDFPQVPYTWLPPLPLLMLSFPLKIP